MRRPSFERKSRPYDQYQSGNLDQREQHIDQARFAQTPDAQHGAAREQQKCRYHYGTIDVDAQVTTE